MREKEQFPAFDQAIEALKKGNNEFLENCLFAFQIDDGYYIEQVKKAIRGLLKRPDLTSRQVVSIGRALHGLERLPLLTPGLDVHIALGIKNESGASTYDLHFNEKEFITTSGGYVDFGQGSDSFSGPTFQVGISYREYDSNYIMAESWPDVFHEMTAAELRIEDDSDDARLDWDHPDGSAFWEWIAEHD